MRFLVLVSTIILHQGRSILGPATSRWHCGYQSDMCDISPQTWSNELSSCGLCLNLYYPALYKSRGEAEFWVNISNFRTYPANLKLTIAHVYKQTWATVKSCCNLGVNESCMLPAEEGEYVIYAPVVNRKQPYCHFPLVEYPGIHPHWCHVDPRTPCLFLQDGIVSINDTFRPLTTLGGPSQFNTEYCFFYAPSEYGKRGRIWYDGLTRQVEGIRIEESKVLVDDVDAQDCVLVQGGANLNLSHYLEHNNTRPGYTICAFIRIQRYDKDWDYKPICVTAGHQKRRDWIVIVTTFAGSVVLLSTFIAIAVVYKKYIKFCFPSYKSSIRESNMLQDDPMRSPNNNDKFPVDETSENQMNAKTSGNGKPRRSEEIQRYVMSPTNQPDLSTDFMENEVSVIVPNSVKENMDGTLKSPGTDEEETEEMENYSSENNNRMKPPFENNLYCKKCDLDLTCVHFSRSENSCPVPEERPQHPERFDYAPPQMFLNEKPVICSTLSGDYCAKDIIGSPIPENGDDVLWDSNIATLRIP